MYKNQLQELAQRSCFNLPCYTCIREGPDHAPRFKATVTFNGEVFESAEYHTTLRQAEHAAAEVALTTLSQRGPTQSLAARILDETGVCKNLLQETAQRAGFSLPVYTTIRTGPKHLPLFKCVVEIGGRHFKGEPAKTKKQAEKNAATAAWSALNQPTAGCQMPWILEQPESVEPGEAINGRPLPDKDERFTHQHSSVQMQYASRSRAFVTSRDKSRLNRDFMGNGHARAHPCASSSSLMEAPTLDQIKGGYVNSESKYDMGQRFANGKQPFSHNSFHHPWDSRIDFAAPTQQERGIYHPQASPGSYGGSSRRQARRHQRRHSLSGMESPTSSQDAFSVTKGSPGGNRLGRVLLHHQQQQIRGLPYQSLSERFELNRPSLLEELQQRDEEDDWSFVESSSSMSHLQKHSTSSLVPLPRDYSWRMPLQSQSERFELKPHLIPQLEEVHCRDEEEWLYGESQSSSRHGKEPKHGNPYRYREGWLQDEVSMFPDAKNLNYTEGWLRGGSLNHSLEEETRHGLRKGWLQPRASKQTMEKDSKPMQAPQHYGGKEGWLYKESVGSLLEKDAQALQHFGGPDGWPHKESAGTSLEKDGNYSRGSLYSNDMQSETSAYVAASPAATSFGSPFSSLWSKSTQWWGSHMSNTTSSAAAVVASSLGLRPLRSSAPAVKVRQMVPVCSAPPPRHPDTPAQRHPLQSGLSYMDNEPDMRQLLSKLRL